MAQRTRMLNGLAQDLLHIATTFEAAVSETSTYKILLK